MSTLHTVTPPPAHLQFIEQPLRLRELLPGPLLLRFCGRQAVPRGVHSGLREGELLLVLLRTDKEGLLLRHLECALDLAQGLLGHNAGLLRGPHNVGQALHHVLEEDSGSDRGGGRPKGQRSRVRVGQTETLMRGHSTGMLGTGWQGSLGGARTLTTNSHHIQSAACMTKDPANFTGVRSS
jgi:hypothetical protein